MSRIGKVRESLDKALQDESKFWTKYLAKIEKQCGVDRLYVFLGMVIFHRLSSQLLSLPIQN